MFFVFSFICAIFACRGNRVDTALVSRHKELQREVCDLTEAEEQLDELISKCNLQLRLLTEDPQNKKYPFDRTVATCSPTATLTRMCPEFKKNCIALYSLIVVFFTLGYVRCQDLRKSFDSPDQLVMVIRAPPETQMQVTEPSKVRAWSLIRCHTS